MSLTEFDEDGETKKPVKTKPPKATKRRDQKKQEPESEAGLEPLSMTDSLAKDDQPEAKKTQGLSGKGTSH